LTRQEIKVALTDGDHAGIASVEPNFDRVVEPDRDA